MCMRYRRTEMGVYVRYGRTEGCVCEVWEDRGGCM